MSGQQKSADDQAKDAMRQQWTRNAVAWRARRATHGDTSRAATEAILEAARVRPGLQVLDLASGTGEPSLALATAVAPDGHVTATDLVADMLAVAEETAQERRLGNMSFQVTDAEALPFADASFDVVTCRFGVMFFPRVERALAEVHRVLRPGGRAAFVVWGLLEENPYFAIPETAAKPYVESRPAQRHRFGPADTLAAEFRAAGFSRVIEERRAVTLVHAGSPAEVWDRGREQNQALRDVAEKLPAERFAAVRQACIDAATPYYDGASVRFPAVLVVVSAEK